MSDINYSVNINVSKDILSHSASASGITAAMNVAGLKSDTYVLSATPTSISTASLTSVGLAFMRNLATATATTCSIGVVSGASMIPFASLRAGEAAVLRLSSGATYQASGDSNCRLLVNIIEG
jgi:hypothetical protein